jgi:hypothetical protein
MEFDPHTIHHILQRIRQQMRCPQCGDKVPVEMASVRITGDDFLIMQLRCDACDAYIVLHASLQGIKNLSSPAAEKDALKNASSSIKQDDLEVEGVQRAIERAAGSFDQLFKAEKKSDIA